MTKLDRKISVIYWIGSTLAYWVLIITGISINSSWLLAFLGAILFVSFFIYTACYAVIKLAQHEGIPPTSKQDLNYLLPKWIPISSDIAMTLVFLTAGHWFIALIALGQGIMEYLTRTNWTFYQGDIEEGEQGSCNSAGLE